ncbi:hypothetical protein [uncultured Alistipes sp.]|jgi:hypothetical protein|uniref:hypothetical protein n=1 Tax=uncultured Alistipes sp. TaxID=538949 RepID=UPI0025CDE675|nr:hypothetical protein [uncultured Alistipes sp.]
MDIAYAAPTLSAKPIPFSTILGNFRPKSLADVDSFYTFALDFLRPAGADKY